MRKLLVFFTAFLLLFALAGNVFAANHASNVQANANVSSDGSCMVSLSLTLHIEQPVSKLYFPVPAGASGIRVNGSRVMASKSGDALMVNLSRYVKNITGDVSINLQYNLYGLVRETDIGTLELQLPLLSGFDYPIEALHFTVTLPGQTNTLPAFRSGYHQATIEQHLTYTVEGATITGNSLKAMKNQETLMMSLVVDDTLFNRVVVGTQSVLVAQIGMLCSALLALVYWLLTLRSIPRKQKACQPPYGFSAGQLPSVLGSSGPDLTTMVLSWAQLGYILIQPEKRGKILLHKRMEMGNERSDFEQRCFRSLFGSRTTVDATGARYAQLRLSLAAKPAGMQELLHRHSGNNLLFRLVSCGIGLFSGGGIGSLLGSGAALQWLLTGLLAILGACSAWLILPWTDSALVRNKRRLFTAILLCLVWILLGLAAGKLSLGIWMAVGLLLCGLLLGWSGRRTALGKDTRNQVLGLRRYLQGGDKEQLRHAMAGDPDYFFRMAPYAIALGVGKPFAHAMGKAKLERCPYVTVGADGSMDASQWNAVLEKIVRQIDARSENLWFENLLKFLNRITKP